MVKFCDLKIGDKVKVVDEWDLDCVQAPYGEMDIYLGQIMTISEIMTRYKKVRFGECMTWVWNEHMIDRIVEDNYDDNIDDMVDISALFDLE